MNALEVRRLNKTFPGGLFQKSVPVLQDVSFALAKGSVTGFVGGNGSGKTTTLKCIFDFVRPDGGDVRFFGEPLSAQVKARLGYLPERPYFYDFVSGREFLRLFWSLGADGAQGASERIEEVLKQVGLGDAGDKKLRGYSKGMLQRIGLAQAILTKPELLILDEPMSGLDPDGRLLVKDILDAEKARGTTIFFSSHLLQDMQEVCTHLVVIDRGQILYQGEMKRFLQEFQTLEQAYRVFKTGARA